jgi:hypothetical protein
VVRRGLLAAFVLALLLCGGQRYGRHYDAATVSPSECLAEPEICEDRLVEISYLKVVSVDASGVVEVRHGPRTFRLLGVAGAGLRPGFDEVSAEAIWRGDSSMVVQSVLVHKNRWLKKVVGALALMGWLFWVAGRRG